MTAAFKRLRSTGAYVLIHPCEVDGCKKVAPFGFGASNNNCGVYYCADHKHLVEKNAA